MSWTIKSPTRARGTVKTRTGVALSVMVILAPEGWLLALPSGDDLLTPNVAMTVEAACITAEQHCRELVATGLHPDL